MSDFLFRVTRAAITGYSLDQSLRNILHSIVTSDFPAKAASIYLTKVSSDTKLYRLRLSTISDGERLIDRAESVEEKEWPQPVEQVAKERKPLIIDNLPTAVDYSPLIPEAQSALVLPLNMGMYVIAVLVLESVQAGVYTSNTLDLLHPLQDTLAKVIQDKQRLDTSDLADMEKSPDAGFYTSITNMVSMEFRTPLNTIVGFSRFLLMHPDGPLTENQERDIKSIFDAGIHVLRFANALLDFSKLAAGRMDLFLEFFDFAEIVEHAKPAIVKEYASSSPQITLTVAHSLPRAYADPYRSRQVLIAFLSITKERNQATPITLVVDTVNDNEVQMIRVELTYIGREVPTQELLRLFDGSSVGWNTLQHVYSLELELIIAKQLIELQGGTLAVTSEAGLGTTFRFTVPTLA